MSSRRERPKSATLMTSPRAMSTFSGLMSRWITPFSCAWRSADSTDDTMRSASWGSNRPFFSRSRRLVPSTNSMTRYG